ncbi:MAG: sodium:alanine symporter family protein [Clostridia bacterium]|nr:sodium:alanine symporter family protein [Clostridia bacterium]
MITYLGAAFGMVTAGILMIYGLYATVRSRCLPIRGFLAMFRQIKTPSSGGTVSPFRAFATSLGGTIGVGNLTGVALAVSLGGAGAVFWMWVSAFLCMTVKYFEVYLALKHQPEGETHYGFAPMQYIKKATEHKGFAVLFALLGVFSALVMGSMIQTNAAANAAFDAFSLPFWGTGILFTLGAAVFLSGGIRRVMGALEKAVPILGAIFLLLGLLVISLRFPRIFPAFQRIFTEAFSFSSAAGGFLGSGIALAFRHGVGNLPTPGSGEETQVITSSITPKGIRIK